MVKATINFLQFLLTEFSFQLYYQKLLIPLLLFIHESFVVFNS